MLSEAKHLMSLSSKFKLLRSFAHAQDDNSWFNRITNYLILNLLRIPKANKNKRGKLKIACNPEIKIKPESKEA